MRPDLASTWAWFWAHSLGLGLGLGSGKQREPRTETGAGLAVKNLLLVAALVASLAKQLAVLLLRHTLAALLDN